MNARITPLITVLALAGCGHPAPDGAIGNNPSLPDAVQYLLPPMKITTPVGWKPGETPSVPVGFTITAFASDLKGPRNILPLPNGDVLAVEARGASG